MFLKHETRVSNRLRLLYYWTKTRFFHRLLMVFFSVWVLWLAFIVHKWRLFDILRTTVGTMQNDSNKREYGQHDGFGVSHHLLETAPLEWSEWQRNTFRWWPALFGEYNISLSGHYVTFAPPIVLRATISPDDISIANHGANLHEELDTSTSASDEYEKLSTTGETSTNAENPELGSRIYWLERQMTTMLMFSIILPFSIVIAFILYIFWDKWSSYRHTKQAAEILKIHSKLNTPARNQMELVPLLFSRHELPIECVGVHPPSTVVSTSLGGRILVWDSSSGELKHTINRPRSSIPAKTSSPMQKDDESGHHIRFQVWCLDVRHKMLVMGYSSGSFELYSLSSNVEKIGNFTPEEESTPGVTHIKMKGNRIILARLNGTLESYEFSANFPTAKTSDTIGVVPSSSLLFNQKSSSHSLHTYDSILPYNIRKLTLARAHQKPIVELICTNFHVITSSFDSTVKVFDIRSTSMRLLHTLNGHDRPVISICADEQTNALFSSCEAGLVLCWNMRDGQLMRTLENETVDEVDGFAFPFSSRNLQTELAQNSELIVGFNASSRVLSIWNKLDGELISRLTVPTSPANLRRRKTDGSAEQLADNYDILDCEIGKHLLVLNEHLALSSAGNFLHLWDLDEKALIRQIRLPKTIDKIHAVSFQSLLCCSGSDIYVVTLPLLHFQKVK